MISVILYGRNDSHGYNLHKRAAISINCIAEVLSHPDDEIIFTDYNTPNDLPTFIEAIYDTLTTAAKARLRVLRVRPELHARLGRSTHLAALEPHSRNIAIRRANPRNRWLLFTNTDMVFLPRPGFTSLSEAALDLADGLYIVPRYELPEPLWESFPRTDPRAVMQACETLSRTLHLDEITLAFPYMRYDQPGDFQLVPRQALYDIHGFDERMIHGWHADSNMCKRFYLFFGNRTESLAHRVRGYHCDHTRVATLAHRLDIKLENNLNEFVFDVEDPIAHHQADTWGAPTEPIEEIDFVNGPQARFIPALQAAIGPPQTADYQADSNDLRNFVAYHAEHVLPHLTGNLTTYPPGIRIAYIGANPRMFDLTARAIQELGFTQPLHHAGTMPDPAAHDLLIFDFGLDPAAQPTPNIARITDWPRDLRYQLGDVAKAIEALALSGQVPDILVVNANHHIFRSFCGQFLLLSETPYATHVRKGRPRVGAERLYRSHTWKYVEDDMRSFFGYGSQDNTIPALTLNQPIDFTSAGQSAPYKDGNWGAMDFTGTWIEGHKAHILFKPPTFASPTPASSTAPSPTPASSTAPSPTPASSTAPSPGSAALVGQTSVCAPTSVGAPAEGRSRPQDLLLIIRVNEAFVGPDDEPIRVTASVAGEPLARWTLFTRFAVTDCKLHIPARLLTNPTHIELHVENPQSAQKVAEALGQKTIGFDPRELGIKVQQVTFTNLDPWRYSLAETLDFTEHHTGIQHADECWTQPDELGAWTVGPDAGITLYPRQTTDVPVAVTFTINDAVIDPAHPDMDVTIAVNNKPLAHWTNWPTRNTHDRVALLPPEIFRTLDPIHLSIRVKNPRTSYALGWSTWDKRPRGIRLNKLKIAPVLQYHLGDIMDFTAGGPAIAFVGDSLGVEWAVPDAWGFWTIGRSAGITVPFDQAPKQAAPMTVVISDCMVRPANPKLPVTVKANGHTVAEWVLDNRKPHTRTFQLPAAALDQSDLTLTFETPDPRSPVDFGWGPDPNPLGLRIALAAIGRTSLDIPDFAKRRPMAQRILGLPRFALHVARILLKRRNA